MKMSYEIQVVGAERRLVDVQSFSLRQNTITFLFGESGIGKTMISKAIYGILDYDTLLVSINGQEYENYVNSPEVIRLQKHGFFVFQEPSSHLHPLLKVGHQIREGSLSLADNEKDIANHLWSREDRSDLESLLTVYPKPYRPSGGEKQRILLLMAFKKIQMFIKNESIDDAVFIFDEPTGSLDNGYRNRFLNYLFELFRHKPFTGLIITHDYSMISEVYQRH
ncbi:ATP-binding cassette domain-containing protein, partial [bacterium]|nr:ATP-binding cassette domain-containing protein [bacterium]